MQNGWVIKSINLIIILPIYYVFINTVDNKNNKKLFGKNREESILKRIKVCLSLSLFHISPIFIDLQLDKLRVLIGCKEAALVRRNNKESDCCLSIIFLFNADFLPAINASAQSI